MKILVLGGAGFIGRHVVKALRTAGHEIVIGSRNPSRHLHNDSQAASAWRRVRLENMGTSESWLGLIDGCGAVVNCVGILRERRGESYDAIHHRAVAALAEACVVAGVKQFVHISALGLSPNARSGFNRSKWRGEKAIESAAKAESPCRFTVVRPSLLDGPDGFGSRWLRAMARWPFLVLPGSAVGRLAVLDVDDLGGAISSLLSRQHSDRYQVVELGGLERRPLNEHIAALRRSTGRRDAWVICAPYWMSVLAVAFLDLVHFSPMSYGHLELLGHDNAPEFNALPALLGRAPRPIGAPDPNTVVEARWGDASS